MLRFFSVALRAFGLMALAIYFMAAILFLSVRYGILPNIDHWRPQITQQLSQTLGTRVSLGEVKAEWNGLNPRLELTHVVFTDAFQRQTLTLPRVRAVLSWRSVMTLTPQFIRLEAIGVDLTVRRDRNQRVWLMGQPVELDTADTGGSRPAQATIAWLSEQRQIILEDSRLRWIDESRHADPLLLKGVTLNIRNSGAAHQFSLTATPPSSLGKTLDVRGQFKRPMTGDASGSLLEKGSGQLYVQVQKMRPLGWAPWVDLPQNLESGQVSLQALMTVEQGRLKDFTSEVSVRKGMWRVGGKGQVHAESARLYLSGPWQRFDQLLVAAATGGAPMPDAGVPVKFVLVSRGVGLQAKDIFEYPISFNHVETAGSIERNAAEGLFVRADTLHIVNADLDATIYGNWRQADPEDIGTVDVHGRVKRVLIDAIDEYLPNAVDLEAREWMAKGLKDGDIRDAELTLQGRLEDFPFAKDPELGNFRVQGRFTGAVIDYLPPEGKSAGWPELADMQGTVDLHRADLYLVAEQALMSPLPDLPIELKNVTAHIPNIEENSVLSIKGETTGQGAAYLALMKHSPLGGMLDGIFNEAKADGAWSVPLALTIPLLKSHDTTVEGAIHFAGGSLQLAPDMPPFDRVNGTLGFTDKEIHASELTAQFMGGPATLTGGVGGSLKGAVLQGQLSAKALADYVNLKGMRRVQGTIPYKAVLQRPNARAVSVAVDSNLQGATLDLPKPLGKKANQILALHAEWSHPEGSKNTTLDISLGDATRARLLHRETQAADSYFYAGTIGVNQKPEPLEAGLNVDIQYPDVDADAWQDIIDEFSVREKKTDLRHEFALLPEIRQLRLQSQTLHVQGLQLDKLTFTARQPNASEWRVDVSSSQTAGTLFWREAKGKIAGRVDANFDRLSLGRDPAQTDVPAREPADSPRLADDLDIPAVNLHVNKFRLYGHPVGELSVVGINQERGRLWQLEQLKLNSPMANLSGSGTWRLTGPQRGLTIDAQMDVTDLGTYLNQVGYTGLMVGGRGTLQGELEWRNLPWAFSKSDLKGKMDIRLEKGRFSSLNSRSARLLEFLSLQSVSRLARLDFNPKNLTKEGFPYDNLRGTVVLDSGVLSTNDYRVIGPVGTIVLGGETNLLDEKLNLQAVVIPRLDVSGAAVAAGIAINPIVGIGAFLTQWLLQGPLAKAMTVQYQVTGTWDDPHAVETNSLNDAVKSQLAGGKDGHSTSEGKGAKKEPPVHVTP